MNILTVFISGLFGLFVAVVTWFLAGLKESRTYRRTQRAEKRAKLEILYTDEIALFEKCIRYTQNSGDFKELNDELARTNARMRLLSTKDVMEQSETVGVLLYQWSSEYRAGMPKKLGDTGLATISTGDSKHRQQASEIFPSVNEAINKLIEAMQHHMQSVEDE